MSHLAMNLPITIQVDKSLLAAAARLFSPTVIREMAKAGRSPLLGRLVRNSTLKGLISSDEPIRSLFDAALRLLAGSGYRDEYIFKHAIACQALMARHATGSTVMLSEFRVANCKADLVIFNGTSTAYEIKSERDNLARLPMQLHWYLKAFAQVYVVTGRCHVSEVLRIAPRDVGVLTLSKSSTITTMRQAVQNVSRIDPGVLFDSLQIREAGYVLKDLGIEVPEKPNTERYAAYRALFCSVDVEFLHRAVLSVIKRTRHTAKTGSLLRLLPQSLNATALSADFGEREVSRVLAALDTLLEDATAWT